MPCRSCGKPLHMHDRRRVYPDDDRGPPGSYHFEYYNCPGGFSPGLLSALAGAGGS